jgi:WD40 repeat protein
VSAVGLHRVCCEVWVLRHSSFFCHSGHNGKVSSMAWLASDAVLVSVGVDGAVYEWSIPVSTTPPFLTRLHEVWYDQRLCAGFEHDRTANGLASF